MSIGDGNILLCTNIPQMVSYFDEYWQHKRGGKCHLRAVLDASIFAVSRECIVNKTRSSNQFFSSRTIFRSDIYKAEIDASLHSYRKNTLPPKLAHVPASSRRPEVDFLILVSTGVALPRVSDKLILDRQYRYADFNFRTMGGLRRW